MPSSPVRVRYAPSPTGDFHVGGARTALFNYLFARHHGGSFILRVEDTDQKRYNPQALTWLMRGLRYLGLDWDEGPEAGGAYGPYTQTERLEIYRRHRDQLLDAGFAYRCFCTSDRLEAGDIVDCWEVEASEANHRLRLAARMKLPERAWPEFRVDAHDSKSVVRQTAVFDPRGLSGRAYWCAAWPVHRILFAGALKQIGRVARAGSQAVAV